ncbi:MAG: hypothetical protein JWN98_506 [Abditibacteriota bacterium]|nr:hypothetical protein [Abditibacteriota bacterium]
MALDGLIFDVDGTLVDTNSAHIEAFRRAFEACGFGIPADRIAPEVGKGGDNLIPALVGPKANKEHGEKVKELYGEEFLKIAQIQQFAPLPGARELLEEARRRGLKLAIATSADQKYFDAICHNSGVDWGSLVDVVTTASDAEKSKPDPDIIDAALQQLQLSPAQCAMIGDTPHDAEACRLGGVVCLGVLTGGLGTPAELLRESGARAVFRDCRELLENFDHTLQLSSPGSAHLTQEILHALMHQALQTARDGMEAGEAPIGCVLADGAGQIIARGYNEMNSSQNKTAHAEIVTFARAGGQTPLDARDLILVSTLEPCVMCTGAAMEAAVDTIVYALKAPADSGTSRVRAPRSPESQMPRIVGEVLARESRALFEEWLERNANSQQAAYIKQLLKEA